MEKKNFFSVAFWCMNFINYVKYQSVIIIIIVLHKMFSENAKYTEFCGSLGKPVKRRQPDSLL